MTKASYYEMCEALGNEPDPEEVPVEYDDLPAEVQNIFSIYSRLRDDFDTMNGIYLGKNRVGMLELFDIMGVEKVDQNFTMSVIDIIDTHRAEIIKQNMDSKRAANK